MRIVGHRGVMALSPENTLPSFQLAIDYELDGVETDVKMTKDGALVLIHDETVDRTTNGQGRVGDMTLEELKALDAGAYFAPQFKGVRIPLLSEFLELMQGQEMLLNIEIKDNSLDVLDKTIAMIDDHGLREHVVITSFYPAITKAATDFHGMKSQGFLPHWYENQDDFDDSVYDSMHSIGFHMNELEPDVVRAYEARGIEIWCWCPDTDEAVEQAIACGAVLATVNDPRPALKRMGRG